MPVPGSPQYQIPGPSLVIWCLSNCWKCRTCSSALSLLLLRVFFMDSSTALIGMKSMRYYDRQGRAISLKQWLVLFNDREYQIVKQSRDVGKLVSTIWLGLDHSFGSGPPVIFETMVFKLGKDGEMIPDDIASQRYCTEESALKGHEAMCLGYIKPLDLIVRMLEGESLEGLGLDAPLVDPDGEGLREVEGEG